MHAWHGLPTGHILAEAFNAVVEILRVGTVKTGATSTATLP